MRKNLILLLCVLGLLSGCASLGEQLVQKPTVEFDRLVIREISLTGQTLVFQFKLTNPNRLSLKLVDLTYELTAGGQDFGLGRLKAPVAVTGGATTVMELPLRLDHLKLLSGAGEMLRSGQLDYRLNGRLRSGLVSLPFSKNGKVEIPKLPGLEAR